MLKLRIFSIIVLFAFCLANAASFTSTHGKLRVSGGKILDKNDNEIVLRGMSLYWYQGFWTGGQPGDAFYTSSAVSELANNWNASVVRAAIGNVTRNVNNTSNVSDAVSKAKSMIDWANSAGIYVIIDNHSHIAHRSSQTTNVNSFFSQVSAYVKEKSYTHVLYEIYNEPVYDEDNPDPAICSGNNNCTASRTTWAQIKSFAQPIISTIRANDPDGLIIVGTPNYSSGIGSARQDPFSETYAKNVLYTLHFYAGTSAHNNYKLTLEGAYCANFPVFVTEWGVSEADGSGTVSTSNSNDWLSLLEAAKVSHANWSFSNAGGTSSALSSTSITGNLTSSGSYIKNVISRLNKGETLAQAGLTTKTIDCSSPEPNTPSGPDGRIEILLAAQLANFANKNGADSSEGVNGHAALINTSANFTSNYTFTNIKATGPYMINFYISSTAAGKVSWSGSNISSGDIQIQNTGGLDKFAFTETKVIWVNESPETPLNLSFQMPSANSLKAVYVYTRNPNANDSANYDFTSIKSLPRIENWSYNIHSQSFAFDASSGGNLSIYNLRGEKKMFFMANGTVSINGKLPSGAYLAVYRRGSETLTKTIYLK